ncbi:MAG: nucleotidyltransferase family protein [Terricaulis sp.]
MTRDQTLARLHEALPDLRRRYGVVRLGLFGSVARGEAAPESDVDLVAEFAPGEAPGLAFFDLEAELSALLGRPARIAGLARMNKVVRASVERDLVYA